MPGQLRMEQFDDAVILTIRQTFTSSCHPRYFRQFCECGKTVHRTGCRKTDCPECADEITARRSIRAFKRFEKGRKGRPVLYTVFTVPPVIRERFSDRNVWSKVVKLVVRNLKNLYGFEYGLVQSHPISEDHPDTFHPHLNVLWIQKPGHKAFFEESQLVMMREIWASILDYDKEVVVHHEYTQRRKLNKRTGELIKEAVQIKHLCNYVTRTFPGYASWMGSIRWYGGKAVPKLKDEIHTCKTCGAVYYYEWRMCDEDEWIDYCVRKLKPGGNSRAAPVSDFLPNWN